MKFLYFLFLFFLPFFRLQVYGEVNRVEYYANSAKSFSTFPRQNRIIHIAQLFLGCPYVGGVLEKTPERLVLELDSLDCLTFIENTLALTFSSECENVLPCFIKSLQNIRYRSGIINDYTDRLHYGLDWIQENCNQGRLINITRNCDFAIPFRKEINFMTTHRDLYPPLSSTSVFEKIKKIEHSLSDSLFYFIPSDSISLCERFILSGDIIFFCSTINGLDIAHVGIAYWENKNLTFIHASSDAKKVIINSSPLYVYSKKMKRINGIIVLRINNSYITQ